MGFIEQRLLIVAGLARLGHTRATCRRKALRVVVSAGLALAVAACADGGIDHAIESQRLTSGNVTLEPEEARSMINAYRARKGLKSIKLHSKLAIAAKQHSRDLARHDRISHKGSDGTDPWDRVKGTGYKARLAAENVGAGQMSLAEVFKGWQDSPDHNDNLLLPDATHMGIALVISPRTQYRTFWTLVLGAPI